MKPFAVLGASLMITLSCAAAPPTWQELSSHLFTNAPIVWLATHNLPKGFWIYQRRLPHVFSATVISNAMVLGSLQSRGIPKSSTNDFYISEKKPPGYPAPIPVIFEISPRDAYLHYGTPNYGAGSEEDIPDNETVVATAWKCARKLGLDPRVLVAASIYTNVFESDEGAGKRVNCRGIFLSRQLDGVSFYSYENRGGNAEGFSIEFGSLGKIMTFSLRWSDLDRSRYEPTAAPQEIVRCIREHKVIVMPRRDENYFATLKTLSGTKKLTITRITAYYGNGVFGEVPTNDVPARFAMPFAKLDAVADFGRTNMPITLLSPVVSSEVKRLINEPRW